MADNRGNTRARIDTPPSSTPAAIKRVLNARKEIYEGYMGEYGKPEMREDQWINGIRLKDFDAVIAPVLAKYAPNTGDA